MSLFESGDSDGSAPVSAMLDGAACQPSGSDASVPSIVELACRGGWPAVVNQPSEDVQRFLRDYLDNISRADVTLVDDVKRDPRGVRRLMTSLARNVATPASYETLAADTAGDRSVPMHARTVKSYLNALERLFVIEDLPAWRPHLRSRAQLRTSPVRHFVCPSLAVAALRSNAARVLSDLAFFGLLFESLVVRDLRVYTQLDGCELSHYRDEYGLEVDVILERADGEWAAFEIKLGGESLINDGIESLRKLVERIDTKRMGSPQKLAVITAGGYGYELPDGISVVPITALGP